MTEAPENKFSVILSPKDWTAIAWGILATVLALALIGLFSSFSNWVRSIQSNLGTNSDIIGFSGLLMFGFSALLGVLTIFIAIVTISSSIQVWSMRSEFHDMQKNNQALFDDLSTEQRNTINKVIEDINEYRTNLDKKLADSSGMLERAETTIEELKDRTKDLKTPSEIIEIAQQKAKDMFEDPEILKAAILSAVKLEIYEKIAAGKIKQKDVEALVDDVEDSAE